MNEQLSLVISKIVSQAINEHMPQITERLFDGITDDTPQQEVTAKLVGRSISISSEISVQVVLYTLQKCGLLQLDDREIQKILLKLSSFSQDEAEP